MTTESKKPDMGFLDRARQLHLDVLQGKLIHSEPFWAAYQPFLLSRGYRLRPRYAPEWTPSWKNLKEPVEYVNNFEDGLTQGRADLLDATRTYDGLSVVLKRVPTAKEELPIACYLSSEPLGSDPRNNAVPILDVLLLPDDDTLAFIVMPLLFPMHRLPFRRAGEFADAVCQYLQGLDFMHEHNIAHRDPCLFNLMMDATELLPQGFHFLQPHTYDGVNHWSEWRERRSCTTLRYYFIDFGLSRRYPTNTNIKYIGMLGQDQSYPERSQTIPFDPFKTDIYQLGNVLIRISEEYDGLDFFFGIGGAMTHPVPENRPKLTEMLAKVDSLSQRKRQRRVWRHGLPFLFRFLIRFCGLNICL